MSAGNGTWRPKTAFAQTQRRPDVLADVDMAITEHDFRVVSSPVQDRPRSRPSSVPLDPFRAKRPHSSKAAQSSTTRQVRSDPLNAMNRGGYTKSLHLPAWPDYSIDLGFEDDVENDPRSEARRALEAGFSKRKIWSPGNYYLNARLPEDYQGPGYITKSVQRTAERNAEKLEELDTRLFSYQIRSPSPSPTTPSKLQTPLVAFQPKEENVQSRGQRKEVMQIQTATAVEVCKNRQVNENLSRKLEEYRHNPQILIEKIKMYKAQKRLEKKQTDFIKMNALNATVEMSGPNARTKQQSLVTIKTDLRVLAAQKSKKRHLDEKFHEIVQKIEERTLRKLALRDEAERKKKVEKYAPLVRVLLPCVVATTRIICWMDSIRQGREFRARLQVLQKSVFCIQRNFKWKLWTYRFARKCKINRFVRKRLWKLLLQYRIRRKRKACTIIKYELIAFSQSVFLLKAFRMYKSRVYLVQKTIRQFLSRLRTLQEIALQQIMAHRAEHFTVHKGKHREQNSESHKSPGSPKVRRKRIQRSGEICVIVRLRIKTCLSAWGQVKACPLAV